ncbi:hypothetical protein BK809_0007287 [Diplodia seriata]|uniref:Uncharacterized protein n=1 Tax=Diplodia seriata TaxID=420778 RepID=A0A1S8BIA4_9PEZI|nr:hypothetical protein BK809_0007287 [Diplodia seriata]
MLPPLPIGPSDLNEAAFFSPGPRGDRREASSYFALDENSAPPSHSKHYGPDFIGTSLGGISPQSSPSTEASGAGELRGSRTPATSGRQTRHPQLDESPNYEGDVRKGKGSLALEFVPPGQTRVNTPPDFNIDRAATGKNAGFFFAGPSLEDTGKVGRTSGPASAPIRRKPRSSGLWDSDAILMSQAVTADDEWNVPLQLEPVETSGLERDWIRERLDRILAESSRSESDVDRLNSTFAWDVPEHLPDSPLCPLHPKHRSGGKGICVYHGRRKTQIVVV